MYVFLLIFSLFLEQFNKEPGKEVSETKLRVVYNAPPQLPSPVLEAEAEEGIPSGAVDNGDRSLFDSVSCGCESMHLRFDFVTRTLM